MKRILFLVPPPLDGKPVTERVFGCNYGIYAQPNIFFLYPATIVKKAGYDVEFLDFPALKKTSLDFVRHFQSNTYDVIVFYSVFLSINTDLKAREIIKETCFETKYIFIGTEPTANPEKFLDDCSVIIRGESELTIVETLESFERKLNLSEVKGVTFLENGKMVKNSPRGIIENLDSLPIPDRKLLGIGEYMNPKLSRTPFTGMIISRGCPFRCIFCVPNSLSFAREIESKKESNWRKPLPRTSSIDHIREELSEIAKMGFKSISFYDDQFVMGIDRTLAVCEVMKEFRFEWSCLSRADSLLEPRLTQAMALSGCRYVDIGVESFDSQILRDIKKDLRIEDIELAINNVKKSGMEAEINILLGASPIETTRSIEATFQKALRLNVDYVLFSICTPFPFTDFHLLAKERKWMLESEYKGIDPMKESFLNLPNLSKSRLEKIIRSLYFRFYFRPSFLLKTLRKVGSFSDFWRKFKAGMSLYR
ncbi:MAG: radical SAM protein [Candidatus Riflebacteria bacterium]|nr:radical SAM protein [Candidatus Riflebacteria bacterium]